MGSVTRYSDELKKGIELLYFQPDADKYDEALELIQKACDRKEPDAFYAMARCYFWEPDTFQKCGIHYHRHIKEGIKAGSDLCVLGAGEFGLAGDVSDLLMYSPQISVRKVKEMAFEGSLPAQFALASFYLEDGIGRYINSAHYFTYDYPEERNSDFQIHLRANSAYEGFKWLLRAAGQGCLPAIEKTYEIYMGKFTGDAGSMIDRQVKKAFAYVEEISQTFALRSRFCLSVSEDYRLTGDQARSNEWLQKSAEYFRFAGDGKM